VEWICLAQDRDKWWGSGKRGNEPLASIKVRELLEWRRKY